MKLILATTCLLLLSAAKAAAIDLVEIVKRVQPAVARIDTDRAFGSGVVIEDKGLVITNFYVVDHAKWGKVIMSSGQVFDVRGFLAADIGRDLALLKIDPLEGPHALPILQGTPSVGEKVAVFGNPRGFSFSTSEGIVSAVRTGQQIADTLGDENYRHLAYDFSATWVQTTAAISPGNSGGPLVNMKGEVVGLNTWSFPAGQSLNFAISAVDIRRLLEQSGNLRDLVKLPRLKGKASEGVEGGDDKLDLNISLPTGRVFSMHVFDVDASLERVVSAMRADGVALLKHANEQMYAAAAQVNGILDGPTVATYDNQRTMAIANYSEGKRHGLVKTWNEGGQPVFFAQYFKGKQHGFSCFFEKGELRLLCEHQQGDPKWLQIMSGPTLHEGFSDRDEANKNEVARGLLERLADVEEKLKVNEAAFKRQVKEHNLKLRKAISARQSVEKRKQLLAEIDRENAANAAFDHEMLRRAISGNRP
jgi:S1-C subfamily serine protease